MVWKDCLAAACPQQEGGRCEEGVSWYLKEWEAEIRGIRWTEGGSEVVRGGGRWPGPPSAPSSAPYSQLCTGEPVSQGSSSPLYPPPAAFKKGVPRAPRDMEAEPEKADRARGCRKLNRGVAEATRPRARLPSEVVVWPSGPPAEKVCKAALLFWPHCFPLPTSLSLVKSCPSFCDHHRSVDVAS